MKKYTEILKELERVRNDRRNEAGNLYNARRVTLREALRTKDENSIDEARKALEEAEALYIEECKHNENISLKIQILTDNAKQAVFAENIATICDIWNKYEGKPHGEKTAAKIRTEIMEKTGLNAVIGNQYGEANITIYSYYYQRPRAPFDKLEITPEWTGEKSPALDNNNKILKLNSDNMRLRYTGEYVENVTKHITALRKAHAKALAAEEAFEKAIDEYNALTRDTIATANFREGVKHYYVV